MCLAALVSGTVQNTRSRDPFLYELYFCENQEPFKIFFLNAFVFIMMLELHAKGFDALLPVSLLLAKCVVRRIQEELFVAVSVPMIFTWLISDTRKTCLGGIINSSLKVFP